MLFNKKKIITWVPAAALVLAAGVGYSCSFYAETAGPQSFRVAGQALSEDSALKAEDPGGAAGTVGQSDDAGGGAAAAGQSWAAVQAGTAGAGAAAAGQVGAAAAGQSVAAAQAGNDGAAVGTASQADMPGGHAGSARTEGETAALVWVHVCGSVRVEGVYSLPEGSRVKDAIEAAGGFLEEADRSCLNLAAVLVDATKVYVPSADEKAASGMPQGAALYASEGNMYAGSGGPASGGSASGGSSSGGDASDDVKVDINSASAQELMSLPGIGRAKAEAIIAYREEQGLFGSPEELKKVSGIGDGIYKKLASKICTGG